MKWAPYCLPQGGPPPGVIYTLHFILYLYSFYHQSSLINHQSSIISYQSSTIHDQWSIISHQSSYNMGPWDPGARSPGIPGPDEALGSLGPEPRDPGAQNPGIPGPGTLGSRGPAPGKLLETFILTGFLHVFVTKSVGNRFPELSYSRKWPPRSREFENRGFSQEFREKSGKINDFLHF